MNTVTPLGRIANDTSPRREAWVYALLDSMNVPTLQARAASVTYVYTDARDNRVPDQRQPLTRRGVFVEEDDGARKRLDASDLHGFVDAQANFAAHDTVRLLFAEAMIGNFDWCLKYSADSAYQCTAKQPLYNVVGLKRRDGSAFPLMYDFDLSGVVTGGHPWLSEVFSDQFAPHASRRHVEVMAQVERARSLFSRAEIDRDRREYLEHAERAYASLAESDVDEEGRSIAREYLDSFFSLMRDADKFYVPVVVDAHTRARTSPDTDRAACAEDPEIPIGTPVGEPIGRKGPLFGAALLDVNWEWYGRCPAVRRPVWIPAAAESVDYPK